MNKSGEQGITPVGRIILCLLLAIIGAVVTFFAALFWFVEVDPSNLAGVAAMMLSPGGAVVGIIVGLLWRPSPYRKRSSFICPKCGYDLRGLTGKSCPECGRVFRRLRGRGDRA